MDIRVVKEQISRDDLREIARNQFFDLVKAVVDISKHIMAIGAELHADEENVLLEQGSLQENLWGINFYPDREEDEFVEFDSMINIRPSQGNMSRDVTDPGIRDSILSVVRKLVK